jgi:hypothetical protein
VSRYPAPTRAHHQKFCEIDGWRPVRDATGQTRHHVTYERDLSDGRLLRTRISHPVGSGTYGVTLWKHILRDQLEVSEEEFWDCVSRGIRPVRAGDAAIPSARPLPLSLVKALLAAGFPVPRLEGLTEEEARDWLRENRA